MNVNKDVLWKHLNIDLLAAIGRRTLQGEINPNFKGYTADVSYEFEAYFANELEKSNCLNFARLFINGKNCDFYTIVHEGWMVTRPKEDLNDFDGKVSKLDDRFNVLCAMAVSRNDVVFKSFKVVGDQLEPMIKDEFGGAGIFTELFIREENLTNFEFEEGLRLFEGNPKYFYTEETL